MGKWETWGIKLLCMCENAYVCVFILGGSAWAQGTEKWGVVECVGGGGGGPCSVWKRRKLGEVCEGAVSICFAYICGGVRRSMVDRWVGSAGMTHGRSCSLLLYQHSYAQRSAPLWKHTAPKTRRLNTAEWAQKCTMGRGRHNEDFLCFWIWIF